MKTKKFVRVIKLLLACMTVFCVSWLVCVSEWHGGVRWSGRRSRSVGPTMRTIVAYSEGKQAELDRPSPEACDRLPAFPKIPYINRTWSPNSWNSSWQQVPGTNVSLYAAYYDMRSPQRYVRILAFFKGRNYSGDEILYCQTRSQNPAEDYVEVVAAKPLEMWWEQWDRKSKDVLTPLLLSCPLTEPLGSASVVSVVTEPCEDPTNAFPLQPTEDLLNHKRKFTICVKDMYFDQDKSEDLIEWIEANRIMGVDMIDMYIDKLHRETDNVLLHYQSTGFVRLFHVPIKYKPSAMLWQRRRDHIITYNDCLYRNIGESEFIVPLDVDEIILPKVAYTWSELMTRLPKYGWKPEIYSSIVIQNVYFFTFAQGIHEYKFSKLYPNKTKLYIKRDDVRIRRKKETILDSINLVDNNISLYDEVMDKDDINYEYKARCGRDLPVLKLSSHVVRSETVSPPRTYSKSLMMTSKVLTAFNHYPNIGSTDYVGWSPPLSEVQLNHYKETCNPVMMLECALYARRARIDRTALRLRKLLVKAVASAVCAPINSV